MARISDVMSFRLVAVRPDESVHVAIARMLEENVGSVAVCEDNRLVGMFTERDVLRLAGQDGGGFEDTKVAEVMTRALVTAAPDDDVLAAAQMMGERRIRHLPVVEGDNVLGLIGIRDVLRVLVETVWRERDEGARETARDLLSGR
jgi:CBS domain-containing protein